MQTGRYQVRLAENSLDIRAAQQLRQKAFRAGQSGIDQDRFDEDCRHMLVEDTVTGRLVCCFRVLAIQGGQQIENSYSAQYYDLSALHVYSGKMLEVGRFCIDPDVFDADILRVAWGAMANLVEQENIGLLFGCSSFAGTETRIYMDSFAMLKARYLAPQRLLPKVKAPDVFRFAARLRRKPDLRRALRTMPPLLRTYLVMGGWVADHAVVDRDMNTLHVFTGLEIRAIPPARARSVRGF